jgi:hypothetical protein
MAKSRRARPYIPAADRAAAGQLDHEVRLLSSFCSVRRHTRCQGVAITLATVGPCECICHGHELPEPAAA